MTLKEAIKHAEEVAEEQGKYCPTPEGVVDNHKKCAEEHRQLADWLKDYKRLLGAIQDIKAEILCLIKSEELCDEYDIGCNDGLKLALSRIDKHISGKEGE